MSTLFRTKNKIDYVVEGFSRRRSQDGMKFKKQTFKEARNLKENLPLKLEQFVQIKFNIRLLNVG